MTESVRHRAVPQRTPGRFRAVSLARALPLSLLAGLCLAAGFYLAQAYPIAPALAITAFTLWSVAVYTRPSLWLFAVPALLPVVGFASWTGWIMFEEFDLVVLGAAAGAYANAAWLPAERDPSHRSSASLSLVSVILLALFLASSSVALWRGIAASGGWQFGLYQNYDDPMNSVRLFKSFALVLLVTPLLRFELKRSAVETMDRLAAGIMVGLAAASLFVLWERAAFTGLLDFSADYRATGPFWEMHVGGAALDGFLALSLPFALRELMRKSSPGHLVFAMGVVAAAGYACLATFSRGVYIAVPLSLGLLALLDLRQRHAFAKRVAWTVVGKGLVLTGLLAIGAFVVFRAGGYRASLAALLVMTLALPIEAVVRKTRWPVRMLALILAAFLGAVGWIVASLIAKGPYLVFAAVFFLCIASLWRARAGAAPRSAGIATVLSLTSFFWLAIAACHVAGHWGGNGALRDCAIVMSLPVVLTLWSGAAAKPLWPAAARTQLVMAGFAAGIVACVAVFSAGAYMGGRFASTKGDLEGREAHWRAAAAMLNGPDDWLLGKGLGRFPGTFFFAAPNAEFPGGEHLNTKDGRTFLTIAGPHVKYLDFGNWFRVSQRVRPEPGARYTVLLDARVRQGIGVQLEICEKHLLYNAGCESKIVTIPHAEGQWQKIVAPLGDSGIYGSPWYAPRLAFFSIAVANPGEAIDVARVALIGPDGADLLVNGNFARHTARWFFTSDKYHLPWHVKNIALHVLFDQGAIGLSLFAALVAGALLRLVWGGAHRHPDAPFFAASLVGFIVVGAFDSLLDVPRVAFLFYLVLVASLMMRNPRSERNASRSVRATEPLSI